MWSSNLRSFLSIHTQKFCLCKNKTKIQKSKIMFVVTFGLYIFLYKNFKLSDPISLVGKCHYYECVFVCSRQTTNALERTKIKLWSLEWLLCLQQKRTRAIHSLLKTISLLLSRRRRFFLFKIKLMIHKSYGYMHDINFEKRVDRMNDVWFFAVIVFRKNESFRRTVCPCKN